MVSYVVTCMYILSVLSHVSDVLLFEAVSKMV